MATRAPHSGAGAWAPSPRKLSPAAQRIDVANWSVDWTMIGDSVFGSTWSSEDQELALAERPGGLDEGQRPEREHLASHEPRVGGDGHDAHRDHDVLQAGAHDGDDHDGQEHARERQEHVDQALREEVERPPDVAGDEPERHADQRADGDRDQADPAA